MTSTAVLPAIRENSATELTAPAGATYNPSIGYLRAFITLLVLAHHAALAYDPFAPPPASALNGPVRWWQAFPILDPQRWTGFALFASFNDIFFMALMFFLSGMFVWKSLQRKGSGQFLRDRALRLGLPFIVAAAVVAPLAYYPAYLQTGAGGGIAGYWQQWRSLGNWPAGPAWFVWVLMVFDVFAAALILLLPKWGDSLGRLTSGADRRPIVFFGLLVAASGVAYIPLALAVNPFSWSSFGAFVFQTSRGLHYLVYFLLGAGVGAYGLDRGLLAPDGKLARRWSLWSVAALVAFALAAGIGVAAMTVHIGSRAWEIAGDSTFVLSCAASSFAFLALFVRFAKTRTRFWDSLSNNAYGMYLIHYAFVSWLQYSLLKAQLPAIAKFSIVFVATALLSWAATAALRRIPAVARVI
ncbi:MAG: acyltransferase family protein [Candidatus Sulfotelmatobacter sp.]